MFQVVTQSAEETEAFAFKIGSKLQKGAVIAFFGGLGMGKTAFACEIALNNAKAGKNVWIFSFNLSAEELCWRLIAREAGIELMKMRRDDMLTDEEMQKLSESARADINSRIFIYDRPFGFERIAEKIYRFLINI